MIAVGDMCVLRGGGGGGGRTGFFKRPAVQPTNYFLTLKEFLQHVARATVFSVDSTRDFFRLLRRTRHSAHHPETEERGVKVTARICVQYP